MNIPAIDNLHIREEGGEIIIPLDHNLNDKGILFAGSIFSGAILAAYRTAERVFAEHRLVGALVAKTSQINFLKRLESDGVAAATPSGAPLLNKNGNHMLSVTAVVYNIDREPCAELETEFVLLKKRGLS